MEGIRSVIIGIVCVGAGLLVGYFGRSWFTVELKKEIGLGDVFNISITLIFAFLLQNYFQKRFGDKRAEKEHLIDLIRESIAYVHNVRSSFVDAYQNKKVTQNDKKLVLNSLRNLSNSVDMIKTCLGTCGYKSEEDTECIELSRQYFELKRTITGGGFPTVPYSGETFSDAESIFGKILKSLHSLRITINRK